MAFYIPLSVHKYFEPFANGLRGFEEHLLNRRDALLIQACAHRPLPKRVCPFNQFDRNGLKAGGFEKCQPLFNAMGVNMTQITQFFHLVDKPGAGLIFRRDTVDDHCLRKYPRDHCGRRTGMHHAFTTANVSK